MKTRLFAREHIARVVHHAGLDRLMDETIDGIARACADARDGRFEVPTRSGFAYRHPVVGLLEWMPAMRVGEKIVIKMVGYHPDNPDRAAVPTILSSILVFDPDTGHLSGVMDGTFLTALRTGAASALATRHLRAERASTVGLIGAGAQAVTQLHGLQRIMDVERVVAFDTDAATAASFAGRLRAI
ncbi:MAG: ornithine cyclodeaminase family protein, partial [Pseudomonadota bacterium]